MTNQPSSIIIPLYIYPDLWKPDGTWNRVLNDVRRCNTLTFNIIVNPNSGPVPKVDPDGSSTHADYAPAITALRANSNVKVLGYVHTTADLTTTPPTSRTRQAIQSDIDMWMTWAPESQPQGIFFDEVTNDAAQDPRTEPVNIMIEVSAYARSQNLKTLVFNCGAMAFDPILFASADQIVIFEGVYTGTAGVFPARNYSNTIQGRVARQEDGRQARIDAQNNGYTLRSPQNLGLPEDIRQWTAKLNPPISVTQFTLLIYSFSVPYSAGNAGQQQAGYSNITRGLQTFAGLAGNMYLTDAGLDQNRAAWTSLGTTFASTLERTTDYLNGNAIQNAQ